MVGLTLLQTREFLGEREIHVVETAPPWEPRHYTPIWGEFRVLRTQERADGSLEILVARELLREEKTPRPDTNSAHGEKPIAPD